MWIFHSPIGQQQYQFALFDVKVDVLKNLNCSAIRFCNVREFEISHVVSLPLNQVRPRVAINACHGAKLNVSPIDDFTHCIMDRIGDLMHSVAPINEPWCVGWLSHFEGAHAPGLRDIRATARAMHHILVAHGTAIQTMRGLGLKNLGGVFNLEWASPIPTAMQTQRRPRSQLDITTGSFLAVCSRANTLPAFWKALGRICLRVGTTIFP